MKKPKLFSINTVSALLLSLSAAYGPLAADGLSGQNYQFSYTPSPSITPPYLVTLSVPADYTPANISENGVYDPNASTIKWGPLETTAERLLQFDLVGEGTPALATPSAQDEDSSETIVTAPLITNTDPYLTWLNEELPTAAPAIRDLYANTDGDPLPNLLEFLLALDPEQPDGDDQFIKIDADSGPNVEVVLTRANNPGNHRLELIQIDLETGTETILSGPQTEQLSGTNKERATFQLPEKSAFVFLRAIPWAETAE